jgi:hypothetical protein
MKTHGTLTASIGDLITTAFDEAAAATSDPRELTALATRTVEQLLRRAHRAGPLRRARR